MRARMRGALAALAFALAGGAVRADEIYLTNGSTITGRAEETGAEVIVTVPGGLLRLRSREVARIERAPLPADLYAARAAATDFGEEGAVRALADYAADLGLGEQAAALRRMAGALDLDRRIARIAPGDAEGYRDAARWARLRGESPTIERYLYERALEADPKDVESRVALARLDEEARAAEKEADLERMRRAAEAAWREAERAEREVEALRKAAEDERARRLAAEREAARLRESCDERGALIPGRVAIVRGRRPCGPHPAPPRRLRPQALPCPEPPAPPRTRGR